MGRRWARSAAGLAAVLLLLGLLGPASGMAAPPPLPGLSPDDCPRIADPKLPGGEIPIRFLLSPDGTSFRVRVWITKGIDADPRNLVRSLYNGDMTGASTPATVVWDGKDFAGHYVAPGDYTVHVAARSTGVETIEFPINIVRLGIAEIEAQSSVGLNEWQMVYFLKGTAYNFYATPATAEYVNRGNISELDDDEGLPLPSVPLHTATDEPVMDGANYEQDTFNYPLCYLKGSIPNFEVTMGSTCSAGVAVGVGYPVPGLEIRGLATDEEGAWVTTAQDIAPGIEYTYMGPALPTKATRTDRTVTWSWQCRNIGDPEWIDIPGEVSTQHRFYTIVNDPFWAPGGSGTQYAGPWVEAAEYLYTFAEALNVSTADEAGVLEAFIRGFFGQDGPLTTAIEEVVYDTYTMGGDGGANHYYVWSGPKIRMAKWFNNHARGIYVNCSDVGGATSALLGMLGVQDVQMLYLGDMDLRAIWGIGCPDYTLNLWGGGSHGFSYHHIITRDGGNEVSDACMWLDEDGDPDSLPGLPGQNCDRPWDGPGGYNDLSSTNNTSKSLDDLPEIL